MYLRHSSFVIKLNNVINQSLFYNDASFLLHENNYYPGFTSIESYNYQGKFVQWIGNQLKIDLIQTEQLKKEASFKITSMYFFIFKQFVWYYTYKIS